MKRRRKILLMICGVLLLCAGALAGTAVYLYRHPAHIKALVEKTLSDATGASVRLNQLTYAIHPFHIRAEGLRVRPGEHLQGVYLDAPDFRAELSLEGRFGHKTLVIEHLKVSDFSCRVLKDARLFTLSRQAGPSSFLGALLKPLFALFLFRDISFEQADLSGGSLTVQTRAQTIQVTELKARLDARHQGELTCRMEAGWPDQQVHLLIPRVQVHTDSILSLKGSPVKGAISLKEALLETPLGKVKDLQAETRFCYGHSKGDITFEDLIFTFQRAYMTRGGKDHPLELGLRLQGAGAFNMKTHQLTLRPLDLTLNDSLEWTGGVKAALGRDKGIRIKIDQSRITPGPLIEMLPSAIRSQLPPFDLKGPILLKGGIHAEPGQGNWVWNGDIEARLNQYAFSVPLGPLRAKAEMSGAIRARGEIPDLKVSGMIKADPFTVSGKGLNMKPSSAAVTFSGTYPAFQVSDVSALIPEAGISFKTRPYHLKDIQLKTAQGRINMATRAVSLPGVQFNSASLKDLNISLEAGMDQTRINIQGTDTGLLRTARTLDLIPPGWKISGPDRLEILGRVDAARHMRVTAEVALPRTAFQNEKSTILGDKVSLSGTLRGEADLSSGSVLADVSLNAKGGEVLWNRFYVNLRQYPFGAQFKGSCQTKTGHLKVSRLTGGLKELITCEVTGALSGDLSDRQYDLSAHIPETPVEPLFKHFVVDPFQAEKPFLKAIQVKGEVSAKGALKGTRSGWSAKGDLSWRKGSFVSGHKEISFKGIDLLLPLWLGSQVSPGSSETLTGKGSIRSVHLPVLPEQALSFPLTAGPNRLSVDLPMKVKVPGGMVRIRPVRITGLMGPSPRLTTGLSMDMLETGPLLAGIWPHPVSGTVTGTLDPVHLQKGRLISSGNLTAAVFGGKVIISDPGLSGLFTPAPVVKLDARCKGLHLSQLTAGTEFGEIEGILRGYAKDVEIAQGQPQRFDLFLETVKTDQTPQRISVKAVENIAQLGSGQSPFVGAAGLFASLFKEFPYQKMGVHATLKNDVFRINGTIHEDGKEYLVKRGLFSGVNVVNQNPDNRVSFKDMIKRLKRVTASKGPVVR